MTTTTPYLVRIDSPVGELRLVATASALIAVLWPEDRDGRVRFPIEPVDGTNAILDRTATQLHEYFDGTRRTFDVPLELRGTDFQQSVWLALAEIPFVLQGRPKTLDEFVGVLVWQLLVNVGAMRRQVTS